MPATIVARLCTGPAAGARASAPHRASGGASAAMPFMAAPAVGATRSLSPGGGRGLRPARDFAIAIRRGPHPPAARQEGPASSSSVEDLHATFGCEAKGRQLVQVAEGNGGLPKVVLRHPDGSVAEVYLFGGCCTSWRIPSGEDMLYVRPDAKFDGSKAISGGIPVCWPQFGPGNLPQGPSDLPQHGFVRDANWEIFATDHYKGPTEGEVVSVALRIADSEATRALWDHKFELVHEYKLMAGGKLRSEFMVFNRGAEAFDFTGSLHTYLSVHDVTSSAVSIVGLGLKWCMDRTHCADPKVPNVYWDERVRLPFAEEELPVDSIYVDAGPAMNSTVARGDGSGIVMSTTFDNGSSPWRDTVVWNPGHDMEDCYRDFVCVEPARAGRAAEVAPGEKWHARATYHYFEKCPRLRGEREAENDWAQFLSFP